MQADGLFQADLRRKISSFSLHEQWAQPTQQNSSTPTAAVMITASIVPAENSVCISECIFNILYLSIRTRVPSYVPIIRRNLFIGGCRVDQ